MRLAPPSALSLLLLFFGGPLAAASSDETRIPRSLPRGTRLEVTPEERPSPSEAWPTLEDVTGAPGWRQSSVGVCEDAFLPNGYQLWSDDRGVFLLASRVCDPNLLDAGCTGDGTSVWHNTGTGWARIFGPELGLRSHRMFGGPDGRLFLTTDVCEVFELDGEGSGTCILEARADAPSPGSRAFHASAVGADVGYLVRSEESREVWRGGAESWEFFEELPRAVTSLWANEAIVVAAARNAVYVRGTADVRFRPLPDVPAGQYTAVWGFGADDLWLASDRGWLVHWDGVAWTPRPSGSLDGIAQLWGSEDVLFFRSSSTFGRVVGGEPEILFSTRNTHEGPGPFQFVTAMSGRSPEEVFLWVDGGGADSCSSTTVHFFDGANVHAF